MTLIDIQVNVFKYRKAKMTFLQKLKNLEKEGQLYNKHVFKAYDTNLLCFVETCIEKATYFIMWYNKQSIGTLYTLALCEEHFNMYNLI